MDAETQHQVRRTDQRPTATTKHRRHPSSSKLGTGPRVAMSERQKSMQSPGRAPRKEATICLRAGNRGSHSCLAFPSSQCSATSRMS